MSDANGPVELLLVEDNQTDAELCIRALKKQNLANSLVWVKDGAEALDFLFARGSFAGRDVALPPKVVMLDLRLPKVDGMEVLRQIRADERLKTLPVVILSSSKEDRDMREVFRVGVSSYVSKSVELAAFAQAVAQLGLYWLLVNKRPV